MKLRAIHLGLLISGLCLPGLAQNYSVGWFTSGCGGNYSLTGGFCALCAVQTLGAPTLEILPAGPSQVTISWTPGNTDYVLQETLSLSLANWTNSSNGATNRIVVPGSGEHKYYRLFKP